MHSSTARKLVVMLTGGLLLLNAGCGPLNQRAERERSIARIREGKADRLQVRHATSTLWLLRNDRVIDALAEIVGGIGRACPHHSDGHGCCFCDCRVTV